jgi:gluconokinase
VISDQPEELSTKGAVVRSTIDLRLRRMHQSATAPEKMRTNVKLAGSIVVCLSAARQSSELLANAIIASRVRKKIRVFRRQTLNAQPPTFNAEYSEISQESKNSGSGFLTRKVKKLRFHKRSKKWGVRIRKTKTMVVVIFGVAGAGKTTIGEALARELGWKFCDADDFHPQSSVEKMRSGVPLTDKDRQPWLEKLRELITGLLTANEEMVLACSALKKKYRDRLNVSDQVKFVFLRGDREQIAEQLGQRRGHFMNPDLLESQLADLEEPSPSEKAIVVELGKKPAELVEEIRASLRKQSQ